MLNTDFPLSFAGNPWTFGGALFSLMIVSMLSLAMMGQLWAEHRIRGFEINHPGGIARAVIFLLMLCFFMRSAPDAYFLLTWGEVDQGSTRAILLVKRDMDTLSLAPFLLALGLLTRGRPAIVYQMLRQPIPVDLWPTWIMVRKNIGITALVLLIATGVTLAK